jgi:hypothetical protein
MVQGKHKFLKYKFSKRNSFEFRYSNFEFVSDLGIRIL